MAACRVVFGIVLLVVIGAFLIACSAAIIPYFVRHLIEQNVVLKNNSDSYKAWMTPQAPIYISFYFFNLTNSVQLTANWSVKPHVNQTGPYVYREIRNKSEVEFGDSGRTLRYRTNKWYVFERSMSCGDENDTFTTINLPLLTIATQVRSVGKFADLLEFSMKVVAEKLQLRLFEERTVSELLWGYELKIPPHLKIYKKLINDIVRIFNHHSSEFGIYVGPTANGTNDGLYEIDTGLGDISKLGDTNSWKNSKSVSYWSNKYCNMINGTDGTLWHPFVTTDERLYSFSSDLCRSIYLTCDKCSKHLDVSSASIPVYRFTPPEQVFADSKTNPDNAGFCVSQPCFESGVLDVSTCRNAPIVMSAPHFFQAAKKYQDAIDGLAPSPEYQTFIEIEPNSGIALHVARKVQVNVHIQYLKAVQQMANMAENTSLIFPVFWLNEHAQLSNDDAVNFYNQVLKPVNTAQIVTYLLYAVGGILLLGAVVWSIVVIVRHRRQVESGLVQVNGIDDDDAQLIDA